MTNIRRAILMPICRPRAKRHASNEPLSSPAKMARSIPTGPKAATTIPGAPTGPRLHSGLRSSLANATANAGPAGAPSGPRASRALHTSAISDEQDRRNHSSMAAQKSPKSPLISKFQSRRASKSKSRSASPQGAALFSADLFPDQETVHDTAYITSTNNGVDLPPDCKSAAAIAQKVQTWMQSQNGTVPKYKESKVTIDGQVFFRSVYRCASRRVHADVGSFQVKLGRQCRLRHCSNWRWDY